MWSSRLCAQRLSASSEFSLGIAQPPLTLLEVLNAFRHHRNSHRFANSDTSTSVVRCSTPFGIIGILTYLFRKMDRRVIECSTPFGIIGILTFKRAFWRSSFLLCSTPFGIIGILTPLTLAQRRDLICAQRLSASSEFSRALRRGCLCFGLVLNAFRHHRNSHR